MDAPSPRPPFARLRRALLGLLAFALAGLALLYWLGRQGAPGSEPGPGTGDSAVGAQVGDAAGTIATSEGFEFEQKVGGKPVFRISGDRFRAGADETVQLEGVALELFRDGEPYQVVARRADWDPNTHEATLVGNVVVSGGDGFSVSTEQLRLTDRGRIVRSAGSVRLAQGSALTGQAEGLELDFAVDQYELAGPTRLETTGLDGEPAVELEATRIRVDRPRRTIRAEGSVSLVRGGDRLTAEQLTLFLAPDERTPQSVQARWQVVGQLAGSSEGDAERPVRFRAHEVNLDLQGRPARPSRITLEAERGEHVVLLSPTEAGTVREIAARYLVATLTAGRPVAAQGFQPVFFSEYPEGRADAPLRTAQADQVEAEFDAAGALGRLTLIGRVSFQEERVSGRGERGFVDLERGRAELFGRAVRLTSERGELVAPHVAWDRTTGLTTADGGVQAKLEPEAAELVAGAAAGGRGPVRVEAQEAIFQEAPRGFLFRGRVQAWQGENVLFAEQLRGEEEAQRLSAGGGVRTLYRSGAPDASELPETEITSSTFAYRKAERSLIWSGEVRMSQGGRLLTSGELLADLDESDRIVKMTATAPVRLEEATSGRVVTAERAIYDVEARTTLFSGSPVELAEGQGTRIRGRRLEYDLASGAARVLTEGG